MSEGYYCCLGCTETSFNVVERGGKKIIKCISCDKELDL